MPPAAVGLPAKPPAARPQGERPTPTSGQREGRQAQAAPPGQGTAGPQGHRQRQAPQHPGRGQAPRATQLKVERGPVGRPARRRPDRRGLHGLAGNPQFPDLAIRETGQTTPFLRPKPAHSGIRASAAGSGPVPSRRAGCATGAGRARCSMLPLEHQALDVGNRPRRVEILGAGFGAVQYGVAAIQAERIVERVKPLTAGLVT